MSDLKKEPTIQTGTKGNAAPEFSDSEQLQKEADKMAEQAERTEKRYDENHDIFTK